MIRKIITLFIFAVAGLLSLLASNSAPPSGTGAPGEKDCTTSGCHESYTVNSGKGSIRLLRSDGSHIYEPGKTYHFELEIQDSLRQRFGFELLALSDKDNKAVGSYTLTESSRTQVIPGYGSFADRSYLTYTFGGTSAASTGKNIWNFDWTAPTADLGPVSFYVAGIAADDDGTDLGDYCYTHKITLQPQSLCISGSLSFVHDLKCLYNPSAHDLYINFNLSRNAAVSAGLYDLSVKYFSLSAATDCQQGSFEKHFTLPAHIAPGIYILSIAAGDQSVTQKVYIQNL